MSVLLFILMNLLVAASSFLAVYNLCRFPAGVDSLLAWFIFYFSQIVFTEVILGLTGTLYLPNVIIFNLAILLIVSLAAKKRPSSFCVPIFKDALTLLLRNKILFLAASVILCFGLNKAFINLINPPFGWDSLNYHFTFPVEWLKHGNLANPIVISDDPAPTYYPLNGSLFFLWLIFPFRSVFLADLGQLPFFIVSFLAVYGISKKSGIREENCFLAAALFLLIPNFFKQLQIAYVDVMVAALFLACLNYLFSLSLKFCPRVLFAFSLSLGLLIGVKSIALLYGFLLFLPFLYLWGKNIRKSHMFLLAVIFIIALGGFSYIRNFLETGNPIYPLDFNLFGRVIFKGVITPLVYASHFRIEDYSLGKLLFHEGLGLQTLIFIFPAVLLALPVYFLKKMGGISFRVCFLLLPFFLYLIYRYLIPLANTRYLYPLLGTGMVVGFYTAEILKIPKRVIGVLSAVCVLVSMGELAKRTELVSSIIASFLFFILARFLIRKISVKNPLKRPLFAATLVILAVFSLIILEKIYINNEYPGYVKMVKYSGFWPDAAKAWAWLDNNTSGNNIAYVGRPVPFPLYGRSFKNNVYYVSVNKTDPVKLHYFLQSRYAWGYDFKSLHNSLKEKGNYRAGADYSVWLNNLLRRDTDYLFVYSLHQTKDVEFPLEDSWANLNPWIFKPVFENQTVHIYKISV
ncbi:MAG: hypothetical protein WC510_01335 [Candidatus Omnitrophota bacterium]